MRPFDSTLFVTGPDAAVGKTLFAASLVRRLRALGRSAVGMKPIETGCVYGEDREILAPDGARLIEASDRCILPLVAVPYRFQPKVSPALAAERAGLELTLADLVEAVDQAFRFGDLVVVEGPGAALEPIAVDGLGLDLAERLGAVLLVVARDELGAPGAVLGVLEAARRRGLRVAGIVLTRTTPGAGEGLDNERIVRAWANATVFPTFPCFEGDSMACITSAVEHVAAHQIAEHVLDALRRP
ncbi:dethiobiotin synthase [Myxococcota bacterium]|nr:dethiobiotin synthase [Myxococcota bacterium]